MRGKGWRVGVGVAWVVGAMAAWGLICNVFVWVVFDDLVNERGWRVPYWVTDAYNWVMIGGIVVIPVATTLLAMRGVLPGTAVGVSRSRGFEVQPPARPGKQSGASDTDQSK